MISIKDVLEGALGGVKLGTVAKLVKINSNWEQIVGKDLAGVCSPAYIWQKTLIVHVNDPAFLSPLDYSRMAILEKTQKALGGSNEVQSISIRYNQRKADENYSAKMEKLAPSEIPADAGAALDGIKDAAVKSALENLLSAGLAKGKKLFIFAAFGLAASGCATGAGKQPAANPGGKTAKHSPAKAGKRTPADLAKKEAVDKETYFYFLRSQMRIHENQFADALQDLREILELDPYFVDAYVEIGKLSLILGKISDAITIAQKGLSVDPENSQLNSMLGVIYHNSKDYKRAAEYLTKALAADPSRDDVRLNLAFNHLEQKQFESAEKEFLETLKSNPSSDTAMLYLAKTYVETKAFYKAEAFLAKFIDTNPEMPQGYGALGWVYTVQKKYDPAIEVYKKYLDTYAPNEEIQQRLANVYLLKKSYNEALDVYKDLEKGDHGSNDLEFKMGLLYFQQGEFKQALEKLQLVRLNDKENKAVPFYIARIYEELELFKEAAEEWEIVAQSATTDNDKADISVRIAGNYEKLKDLEKAEEFLRRAMSYKKEDPDLYYMLGILLGKMERYPDSVDALDRAIALAPARADFVFYLGVIYEKTNEFEKCVAAMKQAAVLNPKHADALNYVGYIYAERGENLAEALEYVNKALEIDPNNAFYEDSLAWIYYKQKNLPLALEAILKSVSHLKEKDATIYHHLGDVYFAMAKWEKSVEAYSISVGLKMDLEIMQKIENARNLADPTRAEKTNALIKEKRASGRASEGMTGVIKK